MPTANTIPQHMTAAELVENVADAERLLAKARVCFGPNARAVRELTAEISSLKAEAARRGLAIDDLTKIPTATLLRKHSDAVRRQKDAEKAGDAQAAMVARKQSAACLSESKRRAAERDKPASGEAGR